MAYLNFISDLSAEFSRKLIAILPNVAIKATEINIKGLNGSSETQVDDKCFGITKKRFEEIATLLLPNAQDLTLLNRAWKECDTGRGTSLLELMINDHLRKENLVSDVQLYTHNSTSLVFNIRISATLPTQQPTSSYKSLYYGPFDHLQEMVQGQYAITCAVDVKPILASWHFASCVGFAAFSSDNHIGILAHIDANSNLKDFKSHITKTFNNASTYIFEYVLIGGFDDGLKRELIKKEIEELNTQTLNFIHIENLGTPFSQIDLHQDSFWIASVRLSRSAALDTRQDSLTTALMSYEPYLNDQSSVHQRKGSLQEADAFVQKRRSDAFSLIYQSDHIINQH